MPCYHPMTAWYGREKTAAGKRSLVFNPRYAVQPDDPQTIPCGQCVGCRLERSRQWAIRCMHEAQMHEDNSFITLTFTDEELAKRDNPMSVDVEDFKLFMKRLRKRVKKKVRYYHCGEYGDNNGRPHYHACLFNYDPPDKKLLQTSKTGHRLYVSETLMGTKLFKEQYPWLYKDDGHKDIIGIWPYGKVIIGDVTFESAAYVARYIMKKVNGSKAESHYEWVDENGVIRPLKPEYTTMSRRPGIGKTWFDKYSGDVYPKDFVTVNGKKVRPPKFYDKEFEKLDSEYYDQIKDSRLNAIDQNHPDITPDRLEERAQAQKLKMKRIARDSV